MAKGKKQSTATDKSKPVAKDAMTSGVNSQIKDLQRRMGDAVSALRAEVKNGNQEQAARATRALAELRGMHKIRGMRNVSNSKEAAAFLKAVESHQVKIQSVAQTSRKTKGKDGLTLTERMRKENQEMETKDNIVATLRRIAEDQQERDEEEREKNRLLSKNVRNQLRQGLSAFLGPAGPLIETFADLRDAYGDDVKDLAKRVKNWWKSDKAILRTHEQETSRRDRQDRLWWSRIGGALKGMSSSFGGGGWISRLLEATGLKRVLRTVLGSLKGLASLVGRSLGKLFGKAGKLLSKGGLGVAAKGFGKLAARALPFVGAAIGTYDLATKNGPAADESKVEKGLDYASGALSGASIGALFGGPIGAAVGAVLGTAFTGIMRNKSAIMEKLSRAWDKVSEVASSAYEVVTRYGRGIGAFFGSIVKDLKDGVSSLVDWLDTNIPGFSALRGFVSDTAGKVGDTVEEYAPAVGAAAKDIVMSTPIAKVAAASIRSGADAVSAVGKTVGAVASSTANALKSAPEGSLAADLGKAAAGIATGAASTVAPAAEGLNKLSESMKPNKLKQPSAEIKDAILGAADTHGVDRGYMLAMGAQESSFNPKAAAETSSAKGLYQFIDSTWKEMVGKYGKEHGIGLKDRYDPKANATMAAIFAKDNGKRLEKQGHEVNSATLYAAHMLGGGGANALLSARKKDPNASAADALPAAARANRNVFYNKGGSPKSVDGVYSFFEHKISSKANVYNAQLSKEGSVAENKRPNILATRGGTPIKTGKDTDSQVTAIGGSVPETKVSASVAPATEPYKQVASRSNDVVVSESSNAATATRGGGQQGSHHANYGSNVQTSATDVPFVLGDNHMIVINAGMMGA